MFRSHVSLCVLITFSAFGVHTAWAQMDFLTTTRGIAVTATNSCDQQSDSSESSDTLPFSQAIGVTVSDANAGCVGNAEASATQDSFLTSDRISGTGDISLMSGDFATASASSFLDATFSTTEPLRYTLEGIVIGAAVVQFSGPVAIAELTDNVSMMTGIIQPGTYNLAAGANLTDITNLAGTEAYEFTLTLAVPEPAWSWFHSALLLCLTAKFRRLFSTG